ncbi:MAG: hypothetical protein O2780_05290 [Proteobacteria bacterium]|nr:hypothetical protein [Pseudomonadota bacterium]
MMNPGGLTPLLATLLVLAGCTVTDNPGPESGSEEINGRDLVFHHHGVERTYKIYLPGNLPDRAPMLFALHGLGVPNRLQRTG